MSKVMATHKSKETVAPKKIRVFGGKEVDWYPPTYCKFRFTAKPYTCTECHLQNHPYGYTWKPLYIEYGIYKNCGGRVMSKTRN